MLTAVEPAPGLPRTPVLPFSCITPVTIKSKMLKLMLVVQLLYASTSSMSMKLMYEWGKGEMDLEYPSQEIRNKFTGKGFKPEELYIPRIIGVHKDKLFVKLPWHHRNDSVSVAYVNLTDTSTMSPKFIPYPSWDAHLPDEREKRPISKVYAATVDRCDRLWLVEREYEDYPWRIIVLDLNSDTIIRTYVFPAAFGYTWTIVVEDGDCKNTFAYVHDYELGGFWTYAWAENSSWHIEGHKEIEIIILAPNCDDAFSTLYYHKDLNDTLFISTEHLRDASGALSTVNLSARRSEFVYLRSATFDPATNILYTPGYYDHRYIHLIPCWNKKMECLVDGIGDIIIHVDNSTWFYSSAVDREGDLWIAATRGSNRPAVLKFSPPTDNMIDVPLSTPDHKRI